MGFRFRRSTRLGPLRFNYRFAGLQPPAGIGAMPGFLIALVAVLTGMTIYVLSGLFFRALLAVP